MSIISSFGTVQVGKSVSNGRTAANIDLKNEFEISQKPPTHPAIRKRYSHPDVARVARYLYPLAHDAIAKTTTAAEAAAVPDVFARMLDRLPPGAKLATLVQIGTLSLSFRNGTSD